MHTITLSDLELHELGRWLIQQQSNALQRESFICFEASDRIVAAYFRMIDAAPAEA